MRSFWLLLLCYAPVSVAQGFFESQVFSAQETLKGHPLRLNPATDQGDVIEGHVVFLNETTNHTWTQNNTVESADVSGEIQGVGVIANAGSGLMLGVSYQKLKYEDTLVRDQRDAIFENLEKQQSMARLAVDLTDQLRAGFLLKFVDVQHDLLGSFFVDDRLILKPSFFGSGGGFVMTFDQLIASGAWVPPMRGKATVFGEEFIITEPGLSELILVTEKPQGIFGLGSRRWLYQKDDRANGTTANDANQTQLSLMGLNSGLSKVFPIQAYFADARADVTPTLQCGLRLAYTTYEVHTNLQQTYPGQGVAEHSFQTFGAQLQASVQMQKAELGVTLLREERSWSAEINQQMTSYKHQHQGIVFHVLSHL